MIKMYLLNCITHFYTIKIVFNKYSNTKFYNTIFVGNASVDTRLNSNFALVFSVCNDPIGPTEILRDLRDNNWF